MRAFFESLIASAGPWTLMLIFAVVMLESAAFIGLIAPGEVAALIAGWLAAAGAFSLSSAFGAVAGAAIAGDLVGYALGRWKGQAVLTRWAFARRHYERHRERIANYFHRWGSMTVVIGRFVAVGRVFVPFVAGLSEMALSRFVPMAVIAGVLWGGAMVVLGYLLGSQMSLIEKLLGSISAGIVVLFVLSAAIVMLWRWAAAHQARIVAGWRARAQRYGINPDPYIEFIRARFSPSGYLGLHLTVGLLCVGATGWLFGGVIQDIYAQDPLVHVDHFVAVLIANHHTPVLDTLAAAIASLANWWWLVIVVTAAAAGSALAGDMALAIAGAPILGGAYLLAYAMSELFEEFSPSVPASKLVHGFQGFPSIILTAVTAAYGLAGYAVAAHARTWRIQTVAVAIALYLVLLIGLGELYMGQLLSATIGGFALGGCWLAICLTGLITYKKLSNGSLPGKG